MAVNRRAALAAFLQDYTRSYLTRRNQDALSQQNFMQRLLDTAAGSPDAAERFNASGITQVGGMPISAFMKTPDQKMAEFAKSLEGAHDLSSLPTAEAASAQFGVPKELIAPLIAEREKTVSSGMAPTPLEEYVPGKDSSTPGNYQKRFVSSRPSDLIGMAPTQTKPNAIQEGQDTGIKAITEQPYTSSAALADIAQTGPAKAQQAGAVAGAQEKAKFPWQILLERARAASELSNHQLEHDYDVAHPQATTQERNRVQDATDARQMIGDTRILLKAMADRGLLGALRGRIYKDAANNLKTDAVFNDPQDAQLAAAFFSQIGMLQSKAMSAHMGLRGAASPGMAARFDQIINGIGDLPNTLGQLNAVDRTMQIYQHNPDAPASLDLDSLIGGQGGVDTQSVAGSAKAKINALTGKK